LRVAYRASREGPRDIVFVPNWFTCCEDLPDLPSLQGWIEAMTSLGRLILFDQPGSGVSDPVEPGAPPTLEQWADSITAVLDDLGSREAVLVTSNSAFATAALFAATHPSRTSALVALEAYADPTAERTDGGIDPAALTSSRAFPANGISSRSRLYKQAEVFSTPDLKQAMRQVFQFVHRRCPGFLRLVPNTIS
jgi:pimeloyl-ACP methyl ester carboxylesterase